MVSFVMWVIVKLSEESQFFNDILCYRWLFDTILNITFECDPFGGKENGRNP